MGRNSTKTDPRWAKREPKYHEDRSKMRQHCAKMGQYRAKMGYHRPKMSQNSGTQKTAKTQAFLGPTAGRGHAVLLRRRRPWHFVHATASWALRPCPDLRAHAQQPARGPTQGKEEKGGEAKG